MTFRQFAFYNVIRNKRLYAAYFLSSAFSVMIFFIYAMFIFHPDVKEGVFREIAIRGMEAAEYVIYVFSFFFIFYSVRAFLKSRKREFGILMMHGMTRSQLNKLIFLENILIGLAATVTGMIAGMLFAKLFLMIGAKAIIMESLPFHLSWKALLLTFGAFTVLFVYGTAHPCQQTDRPVSSERKAKTGTEDIAASLPIVRRAAHRWLLSGGNDYE
ncbi:ABC transporter permease [Brevibacillus humidisoli]|uniref:FtsX-like permease family protein n=1 Tax=Brevibacillus humidisoli TaxID=2895522 RepID=UPI001E604E79|nr:ABC transporter permease [Brevibacillus humidisoli]UFJ39229.1 ABC transporter permease [Brevibacillus humidisoli]